MKYILFMGLILCSCTISMQNVSTNGEASDMIDQDQKADADIKPNVSIPSI